MPTCELCGAEEKLTRAKVSGAELQVCSDCENLGTTLDDESESDSTTSKYSTSSGGKNTKSSGSSTRSKSSSSNSNTNSNNSGRTDFDDISELAFNYGDIIMEERKRRGMNRDELAQELGIKKSHLRNIEKEKTQPDMKLQDNIESYLDIDITMGDIDQ